MTTEPPLMSVDVPKEVAREAAWTAAEHNIAVEDVLVRLTTFDYPADVIARPPGTADDCSGP